MQNIILKYKNLDENQKFAIAIPVLFLLSGAIHKLVERFRISDDFHWLYAYGSTITLFLSCFLVIFSLTNSILILRDLKIKPIPKLLWFLLSLSVFLYLTAMFLIA